MAVFNYDARWTEVLRDAGTKEVLLYFPEIGPALALRQKLYSLRSDMKKENHPFYELASKVGMAVLMIHQDGTQTSFVNHSKTPVPPKLMPYDISDKGNKKAPIILRLKPHDLRYHDILEDAGYQLDPQPDLG